MRGTRRPWPTRIGLELLFIATLVCCGGEADRERASNPAGDGTATSDTAAPDTANPALIDTAAATTVSAFDWPPPGLEDAPTFEPWKGDLPGMEERRVIRFLTVFNPQYFYIDRNGEERGLVIDAATELGKQLNARPGHGRLPIIMLVLPVPRDRLIPMLRDGLGDIAAGNITITPERLAEVDFTIPNYTGVSTIVVTGPGVSAPTNLAGLSGRELHVRESTSHWDEARALSDSLAAVGLPPIDLVSLPGFLESDQVLEMVAAGTIPMTLMDSHTAEFWKQIVDGIELHPELTLASGGQIGWAFRKDSPALAEALNGFVRDHRAGTLFGNILIKRYFEDAEKVRDPLSDQDRQRFEAMQELFQHYAGQYDFDWLMVAAQAYQESRLDQSVRSHVGAIGVMQVLPSTADQVGIQGIEELEPNIHAGVKYLRYLQDQYFADLPLDARNRHLFAFAAYNAGPNRILRLRQTARRLGLDPNQWFGNVEVVAAKEVGSETVRYVSNIAKYYVAYTLAIAHSRPDAPGLQ
ncbi:MAG: transporter substrate-binding domain-containing protein [Candidatus Palauibacterales bacterium]|nr:transporter substrate-binding domain-containing protein [Candidatus Palauibacterales bacterium]MDP2483699.1 transporter substrate-binding domain-containing protein [Candidatus Palauibacterales bacterium]